MTEHCGDFVFAMKQIKVGSSGDLVVNSCQASDSSSDFSLEAAHDRKREAENAAGVDFCFAESITAKDDQKLLKFNKKVYGESTAEPSLLSETPRVFAEYAVANILLYELQQRAET